MLSTSPAFRVVAILFAGSMTWACGAPLCRPPKVQRAGATESISWAPGGNGIILGEIDGQSSRLLFETGFSRTAISAATVEGKNLSALNFKMGSATVGPMPAGLLDVTSADAVIGVDVLHQLPFKLDARERRTELLNEFEAPSPNAAPVQLITSAACEGDVESAGAEGPFAFIVRGELEGAPVTFLLDTGADSTFVTREVFDSLTDRARLEGIPVASGFSAPFAATATRARTLKIGTSAESTNQLVMAAPEADAYLRTLTQQFTTALGGSTRVFPDLDGFLGWSFLREFKVSISQGTSELDDRRILFERFDTQTHWAREYLGIGIFRAPSTEPVGIRVEGFIAGSSAQEAGMLRGDVIVKIDGVSVEGDDPIAFQADTATFDVVRGPAEMQQTLSFVVARRDLLPDPP